MFCPPALTFLGELEFILYVLLLNMICDFLSGLSCKKKITSCRNEIRREKRESDFNDLLCLSSSQDTWRWFRSQKVRSTSRSKNSPCRKITSVSDDHTSRIYHEPDVHLVSFVLLWLVRVRGPQRMKLTDFL